MKKARQVIKRLLAPSKKALAAGLWHGSAWVFDNPLWIAIELRFKYRGVIALIVIAIAINFGALFYYRRKKVPWLFWDTGIDKFKRDLWKNYLGISVLAGVVFFEGSFISIFLVLFFVSMIFLVIRKIILNEGILEKIFMFFILSFWQDSFITTAYLRRDGKYDGLGKKDWAVFSLSSVVSLIYWALRNGLITEIFIRPII